MLKVVVYGVIWCGDIVLLAPSWKGFTVCLLDLIGKTAADRPIDVSFNINKTGCMIFNPYVKHKIVSDSFFAV